MGLVAVVGVAMFMFFGMNSATQRMRAEYKNQTAMADGIITNVSLSSSSKIYKYEFTINGVTL